MGANSKIEWTDHTFNPWRGCTKVSDGCKFCYADTMSGRNPGTLGVWGPNGTRVVARESMWRQPVKWNRDAAGGVCIDCAKPIYNSGTAIDCDCGQMGAIGERRRPRVFCASLGDVFEDWSGPMVDAKGAVLACCRMCGYIGAEQQSYCPKCQSDMAQGDGDFWPLEMSDVRDRLFELIDATPNLDWLLLTKRPENIRRMWPQRACQECTGRGAGKCPCCGRNGPEEFRQYVWLGTSVENQATADERIPNLLKCWDLSPVLFLSAEPLLGPVDLTESCITLAGETMGLGGPYMAEAQTGIDWVIVGGESGPHARPNHPDWVRSIRDQCVVAEVPFFFKQWGEWLPRESCPNGLDAAKSLNDICHYEPGHEKANAGGWVSGFTTADNQHMVRVGKKKAGRTLDGMTHDGYPETHVVEKR